GGDGVGDGAGFACADAPTSCAGPGKKGDHCAGRAGIVGIVKVVCGGVVEVDGGLDQPLAEHMGIEVEVALGIARHRGDVMEAGDRLLVLVCLFVCLHDSLLAQRVRNQTSEAAVTMCISESRILVKKPTAIQMGNDSEKIKTTAAMMVKVVLGVWVTKVSTS